MNPENGIYFYQQFYVLDKFLSLQPNLDGMRNTLSSKWSGKIILHVENGLILIFSLLRVSLVCRTRLMLGCWGGTLTTRTLIYIELAQGSRIPTCLFGSPVQMTTGVFCSAQISI